MSSGSGRRIVADRRLRTRAGGTILLGGSPRRVLRLSTRGSALVRSWFAGNEIGSGEAESSLASQLIAGGLAHPVIEPGDDRPDDQAVAVVVPVRNDAAGLEVTLGRLAATAATVIVVDDGSQPPVVLGSGSRHEVIRRDAPGGPAAARNEGAAAAARAGCTVVAFVDAGVDADPAALATLARQLETDGTVAVAPRVRSSPGSTVLARYERDHSPLDIGPHPGPVGKGRAISYVPSTCLVVRRSAFEAVDGFDPALRYGEDVDLVWRLTDIGSVRYVPEIEVRHPPRKSWTAAATQRFRYGTAAGPLARRHGRAVAPWRASPWSAASLAALAWGHPLLAAALAVAPVATVRRVLGPLPEPTADATVMVADAHVGAVTSAAQAATRPWWPVLAAIAVRGGAAGRRVAVVGAVLGWGRRTGPSLDRTRSIAIGIGDDAAYGVGVIAGAISTRGWWAIGPDITPLRFRSPGTDRGAAYSTGRCSRER